MDRETEQEMLDLLLRLKERMGIILVTHRVQSARPAASIHIIEEGGIIGQGTAEEPAAGDNLFTRCLRIWPYSRFAIKS